MARKKTLAEAQAVLNSWFPNSKLKLLKYSGFDLPGVLEYGGDYYTYRYFSSLKMFQSLGDMFPTFNIITSITPEALAAIKFIPDKLTYKEFIQHLEDLGCKVEAAEIPEGVETREREVVGGKPLELIHAETNEVLQFRSLTEAAKFLGIHLTTLHKRVNRNPDPNKVWREGYKIRQVEH